MTRSRFPRPSHASTTMRRALAAGLLLMTYLSGVLAIPAGHCTRAETQQAAEAHDSLSLCIPVYHDELDAALSAQTTNGLILGSINLSVINSCLERIQKNQGMSETMANDCKDAITQLDLMGHSTPASASTKVAAQLSDNPANLCSCVSSINVNKIRCTLFPAVDAIHGISETCRLLLSTEIQQEILLMTPKDSAPTSGRRHLQEEAVASQGSQSTQAAVRCYDAFDALCPTATGAEVNACAEQAIKDQKLDPLCVMHILELRDDSDSHHHVHGAEAVPQKHQHFHKQLHNQQRRQLMQEAVIEVDTEVSCAAKMMSHCVSVTTQDEVHGCLQAMVKHGDMDEFCLKVLTR